MHDASMSHAVFLDEFFNIGVIQKGVSGPSSYSGTDIDGSWSGDFVTLDSSFFLASTGTASATVTSSGSSISGSSCAPDTFSASVSLDNPSFGRWSGTVSTALNGSGVMSIFLTNE